MNRYRNMKELWSTAGVMVCCRKNYGSVQEFVKSYGLSGVNTERKSAYRL